MKPAEPWMQTLTGDSFTLRYPHITPAMLIGEIATVLARIPRFNGHTIEAYSVAQHSVICAEAAEDETGDLELAAYCLLDSAHVAYTGETPRPMISALTRQIADADDDSFTIHLFGDYRAKKLLTSRQRISGGIDTEMFVAAGLSLDRHMDHRAAVKAIGLRALRTERDDLMHPGTQPWDAQIEAAARLPIRTGRIRPLPEREARALFIDTLRRLCPAMQAEAVSA